MDDGARSRARHWCPRCSDGYGRQPWPPSAHMGDGGRLLVRSSVGWALLGALFLTDQLHVNRQTDMARISAKNTNYSWKEFLSHSHTKQANAKVKASLCPYYYIVDIAMFSTCNIACTGSCLVSISSVGLALHQHQFLSTRAGIGEAVE